MEQRVHHAVRIPFKLNGRHRCLSRISRTIPSTWKIFCVHPVSKPASRKIRVFQKRPLADVYLPVEGVDFGKEAGSINGEVESPSLLQVNDPWLNIMCAGCKDAV